MTIDMGARLNGKSLRASVSPEEWQTRVELAACFRLIAHYGLNTAPDNHIAARLPNEPNAFLINPGRRMFDEITASSLVKISLDGEILSDAPTGIINRAGYIIHGAVLGARPEVNCSIHLHTLAGVAVSAQKDGLKHYCQESLRFHGRIGYHEYEGIAKDREEQPSIARSLANNFVLVMRNHGTLVVGRTIAEAFLLTTLFEKSCEVQLAVQSAGVEAVVPSEEIVVKTANHRGRLNSPMGDDAWECYRRIVDAHYPSYAH
jgi:ribulose-5-phosphate 4-epimerase/fuculose-1-phosphate aldolase